MESLILLDSSVLIDYFRKTKKESSFFVTLLARPSSFAVSVITEFEVYVGSKEAHQPFWDGIFNQLTILSLTSDCIKTALTIHHELKQKRQQIAFPDLLIAATAKSYNLPLATLNEKHFNRVSDLELILNNQV